MRRAARPGDAVALPPGRLAELRRRFDDADATESTSAACHRPVIELGLSFGTAATQQPLARVTAPSHRQQPRSAVAAAAATMAAAAAETSSTTAASTAAAVAIWIDGSGRSSPLNGRCGSNTPPPSSLSPVQSAQPRHSQSLVSPGCRPTPALGRPKPLSPTAATGCDSSTTATAATVAAGRSTRARSTSSVASAASAEATFFARTHPTSSTAAAGDGKPLPAKGSGWCPSASSSGGSSDGLVRARAARIADSIGSGASAANGLVFEASPPSPLQLRPRGTVASAAAVTAAAAGLGRGISRLPQDRSRSVGDGDDGRQQCGQSGSRDQRVNGVPHRNDATDRPAAARGAAASTATRPDAASRAVTRDDAAGRDEQPTAAAAAAAAVKKRSQSSRVERPAAGGDCSSSSRTEEEDSHCNESARSGGDDGNCARSESGDKGRRYPPALPRSPIATVRTSVVPSAPPKPPRTFEHDLYVQAKFAGAQQQAAAASATAAATAGRAAGQRVYDGGDSSSPAARPVTGQRQPAAVGAQTNESELHVYESLAAVGASSEAGGGRDDDAGHAVAASDVKPPPLPSRPPPRLLDLSAVTAAAPSSTADRTSKVRSPTVRFAGAKAVGPLKALFQRPWRHRREGGKMKRFASAECLSAERAAPAMVSSKQAVDRWSLIPDDNKDRASMHDTEACSALYASIVLVPAPGSLTRSSSCACVAEPATASAEDAATAEEAVGIASSALGSDRVQPPLVPAAITDSKESARIQTLKRLKIKAKLCQAFSVLGQSSRKVQTASTSEAVDASDPSSTDVTKDGSELLLLLQKRLQHCSSVKQNTIYASPSKIRERIYGVYNELFSYALVVGLRSAAAEASCDGAAAAAAAAVALESQARAAALQEPYVAYKFPTQVDVESLHVPLFCFPDADYWQERKNSQGGESYSFVLTSADGSRTYGYCKRYMLSSFVDGKETARPEVVCVTSALSAAKFFFEILDEFVQRRKLSEQRAEEFLEAAYGRRLPKPGDSIVIKAVAPLPCTLAVRPWIRRYGQDESDQIEELTFTRSMDSRVEDASCGCLLQLLSSRQIVTIFAALLSERKIVLCAERLSTLSRCVTALLSLLYPFSWQHALVPVLPPPLLDVVGSPTPFVVGVLSSCVRQLGNLHMDEVLVVNVDTQKFITAVGDENTILPKKLFKALLAALDMARAEHKYQDLMVSEAFLYFFFESIGSIDEFICVTEEKKEFQKSRFLEASKNAASAEFVRWFTETQMFDAYVVERCEGYRSSKTGVYEDGFISWLQDPVPTAERAATPMKVVLRNLFSKPKAKK